MISSKLKKGQTSDILVQFSKDCDLWPTVISKFYQTCKDQKVKVTKTSQLKPGVIRLYTAEQSMLFNQDFLHKGVQEISDELILKCKTSQIQLKLTVIYMNDEQQSLPQFNKFHTLYNKFCRVLLLRQTLSARYDLNYEIESTLSPQESISYLCDLSASLVDSKYDGQIENYQQKKDLIIRKGNEGNLTACQATWRNMIFQVPGIGKDRVRAVTENFSSYEALSEDGEGKKQLRNLVVGRGVRQSKIGKPIADRIYKVFLSEKPEQKVY